MYDALQHSICKLKVAKWDVATTDTANKDKIIVAARYVNSSGIPCERMVEIKESVDKTGAGTAKDVISSLRENEIDVDMLAFKTYDSRHQCPGD